MYAAEGCALSDHDLHNLLAEDVPFGDLTTETLGIAAHSGEIQFAARDPMRVCGIEEAARLLTLCGAVAEILLPSGADAPSGTPLLRAHGSAAALHRGWKSAQTLVEWCSGIASSAAAIQTAARRGHPEAVVAGTRKNVPGTRQLAVKAFRAGGAVMHRCGLSETILIFAEHRQFLGTVAPATAIATLRRQAPEKRIVVEVHSHAEALIWAEAGADVLQLEKFPPAAVAEVVDAVTARAAAVLVGAAGGINAHNAEDYARAGARLLVTSAPHQAPPRDVQVRFVV